MRFEDMSAYTQSLAPKVLSAILAILAVVAALAIVDLVVGRAFKLVARRKGHARASLASLERIVRWVVRILAAVAIAGAFGFQFGGIWTFVSAAVATLAIGFVAVWSLLSNPTSTILILFLRPFGVGDEIEFPGDPVKGRVADINFFYTTLRADDGSFFQVPNGLFFQKTIRRREGDAPHSLEEQLKSPKPAPDQGAPRKKEEPNPLMMIPDPATIAPKDDR